MVVFTFSVLEGNPFLGKFGPKNQKRQFKLKFSTLTNSNMQNSILMLLFWVNLAQNIKIVSLSWNSAPKRICLCRNQWWWWLFPFLTGNTLFRQIWSQNFKFSLKWNLVLRLTGICKIQWCCRFFFVLGWE